MFLISMKGKKSCQLLTFVGRDTSNGPDKLEVGKRLNPPICPVCSALFKRFCLFLNYKEAQTYNVSPAYKAVQATKLHGYHLVEVYMKGRTGRIDATKTSRQQWLPALSKPVLTFSSCLSAISFSSVKRFLQETCQSLILHQLKTLCPSLKNQFL